jgi:hypothetical protein
MPTSKDSALWLLSEPSVSFGQETVICPVLLWVLVIEWHLLNWAYAQAVCQISDKVTMRELEEHVCVCVCVKCCCKLGKNFTEKCMSWTQCYEWFKHFKEGRMLVAEDPSIGRPSISTNNDHVERVCAVVCGNHCLTVWEVVDEVGISMKF